MGTSLYPMSSQGQLKSLYVGRSLTDIPAPAAVVDLAKVRHNCKLMLNAVEKLGLSFRAHVKTHKTSEITQLQVGRHSRDVRLVVSTVIEAEKLVPLLKTYQERGAEVNVLYGVPIGLSRVERLASVAKELGPGSVAFMLDHTDQLAAATMFKSKAGFPVSIFIKADSGYHRAGLLPFSPEMTELVKQTSNADANGEVELLGFYSHNSLSYGGSSPDEAMDMLQAEINACHEASKNVTRDVGRKLVLSMGASPTALSVQNLLQPTSAESPTAKSLKALLKQVSSDLELEIHAGVYPLFDLQQVGASSRSVDTDPHDLIAISVLAEVCSLYPTRTERPEALVAAGGLALAREPCKSYSGWGVVSPWEMPESYNHRGRERIIVSRISQEHGILARETDDETPLPLGYGQTIRVWPNHACITMAMYGWYFIVDSANADPNKIVDVYARWRGW